jgi:hypothetical protein
MTFASCATLFNRGNEKVSLASEPAARVYIDGTFRGGTPIEVQLEAKRSHTIEFRKEGYQTRTVVIGTHAGGGWIVLDILGGLIPIVVDVATGDWAELDETSVNAALEKSQVSKSP